MNQTLSLRRQQLGKLGEKLAAQFLIKNGYSIVERNFKARYGEIDIIATHDNTLVFVEVKTRVSLMFGNPEEAVTPRKLKEIIRTGEVYTSFHNSLPQQLRVDVIALVLTEAGEITSLQHIQNVTQ